MRLGGQSKRGRLPQRISEEEILSNPNGFIGSEGKNDKVELFLAVAKDDEGRFVITQAALVPQGGSFRIAKDTLFVVHWHHSGLERKPGNGDHSPVKVGMPNFTITYDGRGKCCVVYEVGRQNNVYVYRRVYRSSSIGKWKNNDNWR